jgi:hypothetical protein
MSNWLVAVLIGAVFGLVIGIRIARASDSKQPVRGGLVGHGLHYLACAGMSSTVPFIVAGVVIGLAFHGGGIFGRDVWVATGVCVDRKKRPSTAGCRPRFERVSYEHQKPGPRPACYYVCSSFGGHASAWSIT